MNGFQILKSFERLVEIFCAWLDWKMGDSAKFWRRYWIKVQRKKLFTDAFGKGVYLMVFDKLYYRETRHHFSVW